MTDHKHTRWEDVKAARAESEYVVWTGKNVGEVEAFANNANFGFIVGSYRTNRKPPGWKLIARLAAWLETISLGGRDKRILEIYPDRENSPEEVDKETGKIISVTNRLHEEYDLVEFVDDGVVRRIRELFNEEDSGDYVPWYWTTASPGDRIYRDGTIDKPAMIRISEHLEETRGVEE